MNSIVDGSNADDISKKYRNSAIDFETKKILITNFNGTEQEKDFQESNCSGFGRIRHFQRHALSDWPENLLPIEPARNALDLPKMSSIRAQVFQNAVCNWRCWYCYVPFNLLSADPRHSEWLSASQLVDFYLKQTDPPPIIDLSGGQPDLVPEWIPWIMSELVSKKLDSKVYLWSDDNLSNDYFWKYLNGSDIDLICRYKNYGKVCCFKGFDATSFSFNTRAKSPLFNRQFDLMKKFLSLEIDIYAYITLTTPNGEKIEEKISKFLDELQKLDLLLPLKTIPLEIKMYCPLDSRMNGSEPTAMDNQYIAINYWKKEIESRFTDSERSIPIYDIKIGII